MGIYGIYGNTTDNIDNKIKTNQRINTKEDK